MSQRELVVLGTSSQVPTKHRNHNGYFLRWDDEGFLFDPGEGTQRQMTTFGVTASSLTHVLITHFHGDHCLGLASLIQRISLDQVAHQIQVHYPASGEEFFQRLRWASIYHDQAKLLPRPIRDSGVIYESDRLRVLAEPLDHTVDCFGYRIEEKDEWNLNPDKLSELGLAGPELGRLKDEGTLERNGETLDLKDLAS
ncbi:MAG: MBL fold metallo-hydrolase, partial [Planctomycetota bacterium]